MSTSLNPPHPSHEGHIIEKETIYRVTFTKQELQLLAGILQNYPEDDSIVAKFKNKFFHAARSAITGN